MVELLHKIRRASFQRRFKNLKILSHIKGVVDGLPRIARIFSVVFVLVFLIPFWIRRPIPGVISAF